MKKETQFLLSTRSLSLFSVRAVHELVKAWNGIKQFTRSTLSSFTASPDPAENEKEMKRLIQTCVASRSGEVTNRACAVELGMAYLKLPSVGKARFLRLLARDFDVDRPALRDDISRYLSASNDREAVTGEMSLSEALIPPRLRLLKLFKALPAGFKFLIDMRADLLALREQDPYMEKLDRDLKDLLSSLFDVGLLDLREITWNSPAALLEKLIEYEAVHEIKSWNDLKNRLDSDRRCYAFFHNKIPQEPLVFVEIALTRKIPDNIPTLLDPSAETVRPEEADTAVFYSISNTQKGLAGIHLGNFLIKQVVETLGPEMKNLVNFVTLSPVPEFASWLTGRLDQGDLSMLERYEVDMVKTLSGMENAARGLRQLLEPGFHADPELAEALKPILLRLCGRFLLNEKKGKRILDPVAHFHFMNGASLYRLNWLADKSSRALSRSFGIMANYLYKPSDIEKNHELYAAEGQPTVSREMRGALKK